MYAQHFPMLEREKELSVLTRRNPSYDPAGILVSGFLFYPSLNNSLEYDDNLYSTSRDEIEDFVHKVSPALYVRSGFSRHFFSAAFSAENGRYFNNPGENYFDYTADLFGRVDVTGKISTPLSVQYGRSHSQRSDPDDNGELEPTLSDTLTLRSGVQYQGADALLSVDGNLSKLTFKDNFTATSFIDNSDRDRRETDVFATVGLSKNRRIAPFLYAGLGQVDYDRRVDDNGLQRSSSSSTGGLGLHLDPSSGLLKSVLRVGRVHRSFDDSRFRDIEGLIYSVDVSWEPSTLLALKLSGTRNIAESTLNNFSASIDDTISTDASYELAPNIFLNPELSYLVKDYRGDTDRQLERFSSGFGVVYKLNRSVWLAGEYAYLRQTESADSMDLGTINNNSYRFSIKLQL